MKNLFLLISLSMWANEEKSMEKVIFFDVEDYEREFLVGACEGKYDFTLVPEPLNDLKKIDSAFADARIISCFTNSRVNATVLEQFKNLGLIALRSVGFNHVDIKYCKEHDIAVETTPNYGNMSVAEFAMGLLLDVARKITRSYLNLKSGEVDPIASIGFELYGKTIGIAGLGAIGAEMARLAKGFNMNIIGYDIRENIELEEKYGVKYTDFDTLLRESDVISLHMPLTQENNHIINAKAFKKMKNTAVIINTARGELIETQALYNALTTGEIAGAGLDVLEFEETLSNPDYLDDIGKLTNNDLRKTLLNNRIMTLSNVIVTPHIAYDTKEAINRILKTTIENIEEFTKNRIQNNVAW